MKKIKCYGRVKINKLDSSKNQAVFDSNSNTLKSLGVDSQEKKKFPEPDLSDTQLFASFRQESLNQSSFFGQSFTKGHKKRKLIRRPAKRVSIYFRKKQYANVSKRLNISFLNNLSSTVKSVLNKASNNTHDSFTSHNSKIRRKCKKGSGIAQSKNKFGNKNPSKKLKFQKLPQKNNKENKPLNETCEMSPISNEPYWPSIFEHSLNIENQYEKRKFKAFHKKKIKASSVRLSDVYHNPSPLDSETGVEVHINMLSIQEENIGLSTTPQIKPCAVRLSRIPSHVLESETGAVVPNYMPSAQEENIGLLTTPNIKPCSVRLSRIPSHVLESETGVVVPNDVSSSQEESSGFQLPTSPKIRACSVRLLDIYRDPSPLEFGAGPLVPNDIPSAQGENSGFQLSTSISDPQCSHKPLPIQRIFDNIRLKTSNVATSTPLRSNNETHFPLVPRFNLSGIYKSKGSHGSGTNVLFPSINKVMSSSTSVRQSDVYRIPSPFESERGEIVPPYVPSVQEAHSGTSELNPEKSLIPESFLEAAQNISNTMDKNVMNLNPLLSDREVVSNRSREHSNILQKSEVSTSWNRSCEVHSTRKKMALKQSFHSSEQVNLFCQDVECDLSKLLEHCEQDSVIEFKDLFDWSLIAVKKIGEGTYGEVFMITHKKSSSVIKVIPFSEKNYDNSMQTIDSVYSEMKVAHCLSELRTDGNNQTKNFNKLKSAKIVKGIYPSRMLDAWDTFSNAKTTYNDRPDVFDEHQKFAILELEFGGKDMSEFVMRNAAEAECIFKQIAISLAIAEEAYLFEHRDLHLGNILVQRNNSKKISYILRGKQFSIKNEGLVVTIIDFTLSRVLSSGCVFYNDLANDESLFNQSGDYQFEVYKQTRECLNNEWKKSVLYSNVLWMTFLCGKALNHEYSRPNTKKHLEGMRNIQAIQKKLPECNSALDVFLFLRIVENVPKRSHAESSRLSRTTKFWDRKSLQKSNI